jgi:uncharacterized protein (DUF433 family)
MRATNKRTTPTATNWKRHLTSKPGICGGQLCAKGTRIPVVVILDSLAEGASEAEVLHSYPTLMRTHIRAAIAYAAALAREESLTPILENANQARRESARRTG